MNLKLERRHFAGLNRMQGNSAWVSAAGHGKTTPVAVSRLQVGAPTDAGPVSRIAEYNVLSMSRRLKLDERMGMLPTCLSSFV